MLAESLSSNSLSLVRQAIVFTPLTATADTPLEDAIAQMHQAKTSCIVCTDQQRPVGIFTEQDLVRLLVSGQSIAGMLLATAITQEFPIVTLEDVRGIHAVLHLMNQTTARHLVICTNDGKLAGLITRSGLLKVLALSTLHSDRQLQQELKQLSTETQALPKQDIRPQENPIKVCIADLYQAEHRWRTLLENVPLIVIGLDIDGRVIYANPFLLHLTGYTATDILGKDWFEQFIPSSERPQLTQYFQQLLTQSDAPARYQNTILMRSGEKRTIVWHNTVLRASNGTIAGSMSIGEDITERLVIDRMKSEFITLVGHELRTPLTSIYGGLQLLTKGLVVSESEQGQQLLQTAVKSSQRLIKLVEDILDFEYLESGKSPLQKQPIQTKDLTLRAIQALQSMADRAGIRIEANDPGFEFIADDQRIHQVLTHLLNNAIKFSPTGTTIWLTVSKYSSSATDQTEPAVLFSIRDQGPGILSEKLDAIFDRFLQGDSSDTRSQGGAGLGLAICRKIIEQHGGKIWAESIPGEGSCFYFTLPDR